MPSILISPAAQEGSHGVSAMPSFLAEYVYFPFYDYLVTLYPSTWVPNKITVTGVALTVTSSLLLLASMPSSTRFIPPRMEIMPVSLTTADRESIRVTPLFPTKIEPVWPSLLTPGALLTLCGVLNLIYCITDNTDGRLARRDKKTSVTGEYLDHGLDCLSSLLSAAMAFCVMGCSLCNMSISLCLIAFVTVLSHTLLFEANIFVWGNRIASVDEAMIFFGVCMWIPQVFPAVGNSFVDELPWLVAVGKALCLEHIAPWFFRLKTIELVYIFYSVTQAETILGLVRRSWRMLFRLQTLFIVANSAVLLSQLSPHSAHMESYRAAHKGSDEGGVPGYTAGPFCYPAIWILTCAATSSVIIHVPIAARCTRRRHPDFTPLASILFVWMTFLTCPVGAAALAIALHVAQVSWNLHQIRARSAALKKKD